MTKFAALVIGLTFFPLDAGAQEPGQRIGLADSLKARYAESRLNLMEQAEKMPEEAYALSADASRQDVRAGPRPCRRHPDDNAEMYGVGTVYLRLNDLVPPSTERENARRRRPR